MGAQHTALFLRARAFPKLTATEAGALLMPGETPDLHFPPLLGPAAPLSSLWLYPSLVPSLLPWPSPSSSLPATFLLGSPSYLSFLQISSFLFPRPTSPPFVPLWPSFLSALSLPRHLSPSSIPPSLPSLFLPHESPFPFTPSHTSSLLTLFFSPRLTVTSLLTGVVLHLHL